MPHEHSRSNKAHDVIEDTIDRLLRQGTKISDALEKEVKYAENKHSAEPWRDCVTPRTRDSVSLATAVSSDLRKRLQMESTESSYCDVTDIASLEMSYTSVATSRPAGSKMYNVPTFSLPPKNPQEDIGSGVIDLTTPGAVFQREGDTNNDCMPTKEDHFLGVKSFPCFIRDGHGDIVERTARVTFHRRAESKWLLLIYEVNDIDERNLLVLKTELLGRMTRNTVINGKPVE